jgi:site-specific recombinase XerC
VLSQLIGTVVLAHEYRQQHPVEEIKKPKKETKLPKKGLKDRLTNGFLNFFGDENSMS